MKTRYTIALVVVLSLQWGFYFFYMLAVTINPETLFFGVKFSGIAALVIHFTIGITGMFIGWFIYKNNKLAYVGAFGLFVIVLSSILVNTFSCYPFDLYC
ncbi:MAG: hypothetical protein K8Q89_10260 [Nitrosarchaeum sp.]|nr:hypothetical protein [Nitrosarchaeum sp.]